ncbi:MAG: hypothetical protein WEG40_20570 [Candidatus Rokuibacteriota bacterium]
MGLVLGTGTNLAADLGPAGIRNLESGNFDGVVAIETPYDAALDRALTDPDPGAQRFEKMVSGQYLGELLRRVVEDLARGTSMFSGAAAPFRGAAAPAFATPFGLDSAHLSGIAADETPDGADIAVRLRDLGVASDEADRRALRGLARAIGRRAARLVATGLLGTLRFLDPELGDRRTIAVDGSLWDGYPGFEGLVAETLAELIGAERAARIEMVFVKDSTSAGVAVIAAVAAEQRSA